LIFTKTNLCAQPLFAAHTATLRVAISYHQNERIRQQALLAYTAALHECAASDAGASDELVDLLTAAVDALADGEFTTRVEVGFCAEFGGREGAREE
jgi:hypothetical protein